MTGDSAIYKSTLTSNLQKSTGSHSHYFCQLLITIKNKTIAKQNILTFIKKKK